MKSFSLKSDLYLIVVAVLVMVVAFSPGWIPGSTGLVAMKQFGTAPNPTFLQFCTPFLIVSLLIERAIEMVVAIVRDPEAEPLRQKQAVLRSRFIKLQQKMLETMPTVSSYATFQGQADAAQKDLDQATSELAIYQGETKCFAQQVGFALGCLVALSGIRMLEGLANAPADIAGHSLYHVADVLLTAAVFSGGSDSFHRLINVYTSFVDGASKKLDDKASANG